MKLKLRSRHQFAKSCRADATFILKLKPGHITLKLSEPLPGIEAQFRMAPLSAGNIPDRGKPPPGIRQSAVMLLLFNSESDTECILTLRSNALLHHGNQISLPGGRKELDESAEETALRETYEEVGIHPDSVEILGQLTPLHVPVSGNVIQPVVGWMNGLPALRPDHREVAEAFTLPVRHFIDPVFLKKTNRILRGLDYEIPYWDVHRIPLWGATAMILSEFCEIIINSE